jgi:hypothetical protein
MLKKVAAVVGLSLMFPSLLTIAESAGLPPILREYAFWFADGNNVESTLTFTVDDPDGEVPLSIASIQLTKDGIVYDITNAYHYSDLGFQRKYIVKDDDTGVG